MYGSAGKGVAGAGALLGGAELARTGAGASALLVVLAAVLVLGGLLMVRRARISRSGD
ncbi:LPXTG cell wall anchor domain-containing protein [Kitasatospora sp. NPDC088134]|uniref:LPXTG cell wall anchor domain-containing protein n=1 Tax=Kitasatospora sp. NPDC088134 TaxID=3364071 RepID=UPI00381AC27B